jgi:hypothetical protein
MTKEAYLEMCSLLGSEPLESEMPVEMEDFPLEVQEAFEVYHYLLDVWEGLSGTYQGKNLSGLHEVMRILKVEDHKVTLQLIQVIDSARKAYLASKKPKNPPPVTT